MAHEGALPLRGLPDEGLVPVEAGRARARRGAPVAVEGRAGGVGEGALGTCGGSVLSEARLAFGRRPIRARTVASKSKTLRTHEAHNNARLY
jgi:hypothetical protein